MQSVNLPGQFSSVDENPYLNQSDFDKQISEHFSAIHPSPTRIKSHYSRHIDDKLKTCSHVWLRNDFVRGPLQFKYSGLYEVVHRNDKVFTINVKDSLKTVSIDRLKLHICPMN